MRKISGRRGCRLAIVQQQLRQKSVADKNTSVRAPVAKPSIQDELQVKFWRELVLKGFFARCAWKMVHKKPVPSLAEWSKRKVKTYFDYSQAKSSEMFKYIKDFLMRRCQSWWKVVSSVQPTPYMPRGSGEPPVKIWQKMYRKKIMNFFLKTNFRDRKSYIPRGSGEPFWTCRCWF